MSEKGVPTAGTTTGGGDASRTGYVRTRRRSRIRVGIGRTAAYGLLIVGSLIELLPLLWMITTSFKEPGKAYQWPPQWIPDPWILDNYREAFQYLPFDKFAVNTAYTTTAVTLLVVLTSSLAAYSFARLRFPGRDVIFLLYLGTMMIPGQVTMIPNFILMRVFGWIDTYNALIIPAAFSAFGTFLLRQFFLTIPYELEDSAKIDGASAVRTYAQIVMPLAKPALATLFIFTFMGHWNSFLWPLIVTNRLERMTLSVGLRFFQGEAGGESYYTLLMAASVLVLIPILIVYVIGQRYFIQGITLTGISGR